MPSVLGLRAKTGRAIAVILAGTKAKPQFVARREISLVVPEIAGTEGPYHMVMALPWSEATVAVRAVRALAKEFAVKAVGVVGAPERQLQKIGNEHIRAHAAEGVLFRHVLELAAEANALSCRAFPEKTLPGDFASQIQELGRIAGSPWRADEKMAATAALLVMRS